MSKLSTLVLALCLSAWTVGCAPEADTPAPAPAGDTGAADAGEGETPEAGSVEGEASETP